MPKKNNAKKNREQNCDLESLEDASVVSIASDGSGNSVQSTVDDTTATICRVNEACETLTDKRPDTRVKALEILINAFQNLYFDETWNYASTFIDGLENVLKKGRTADQTKAVYCLSISCLHFDTSTISDYLTRFSPTLDAFLRDTSVNCSLRSACALTLSILRFTASNCDQSPKDLMKIFETIFKGSCLKGDGKAHVLDPLVVSLHVETLRAWSLLYTCLPPFDVESTGKAILPILYSLLQGVNVDMRIAAGEATALVYERLRDHVDPLYKGPYYSDLVRILNELATDGTKSRSKVDRKKQRQSFRDLVDAVTRSECLETIINLGSEELKLTSCSQRVYYELLCFILKGGMHRHLQCNPLIRDLFNLGEPLLVVPITPVDRRDAKEKRRKALSIADKLRTQRLGPHRDRRTELADSE